MSVKLRIPDDIREIHNLFKSNNKKLYVVGGAVRDALLGKEPKDFDLATDATPDQVIKIAQNANLKYNELGKAFGVVVINGHEIATFRRDLSSGRRPTGVEYTDIYGDVSRRDLTINALFYDLDKEMVVDLVGGVEDLKNKRIRTVGEPTDRFAEDPLRKLRTLRFAARFGSQVDNEVFNAIKNDPTLKDVSLERVRDEFIKSVLTAKSVKYYLQLTNETGILPIIFPNKKISSSDFIEEKNIVVLLSFFFRSEEPNVMYKYLMDLKYTHDEAFGVQFLLNLIDFNPQEIFRLKKMQERASLTDDDINMWGKYLNFDFSTFTKFKLTVSGHDVMGLGYKGKELGNKISDMEKDNYIKSIIREEIFINKNFVF